MFGGNNLYSLTKGSSSNDETQPQPACVPNLTAARQFAGSTISKTTTSPGPPQASPSNSTSGGKISTKVAAIRTI